MRWPTRILIRAHAAACMHRWDEIGAGLLAWLLRDVSASQQRGRQANSVHSRHDLPMMAPALVIDATSLLLMSRALMPAAAVSRPPNVPVPCREVWVHNILLYHTLASAPCLH